VSTKNESGPEFRLRPRRPPKGGKSESIAWSVALRTVFRYASTSARNHGKRSSRSGIPRKKFSQRCAVRITYAKNKIAGQWRAHGRYIARESATQGSAAGFNAESAAVEPAQILNCWQKQGDARLWKFIISPEFGERIDLQRLTRDLMQRMETDLGTRLEWVSVSHFNTEHPHAHVALRGVRGDGSVLDLPRDYVKFGIRMIAEDLCTRQLGYRTELDAREAQRREVDQCRVTSLDRIIDCANGASAEPEFVFRPDGPSAMRDQAPLLAARLNTLQKMGLATQSQFRQWRVRSDFLTVLKAMQQTADRQKTLSAHRTLVSDERLPLLVTEPRKIKHLEGRVLGHGEDEGGRNFGRHCMLLEGTDANIHLIYYTPELEEARSRGKLSTNSFVQLRNRFENGRPLLEVTNSGNAEQLLNNSRFFDQKVRQLAGPDAPARLQEWDGWLGRYHAQLKSAIGRAAGRGTLDHTH
jgi:type IV secretory pathway VirD2 relaxase